jgi:glycosyltransferase involved in cell wall biosynthesis
MRKKLLFIVNVDWFFVSHRLPIALEAIRLGYDVYVACQFTDKHEYLQSLGLKLYPLTLSRSGMSLFSELSTVIEVFKLVLQIKPDVIHLITIKPVIYGGIASRLLGVKQRVASISGLGYVFIANGFKNQLLRKLVSSLYRFALRRQSTDVIFQNPNDRDLFIHLGIINAEQATMIRGSGVELSHYAVIPEPDQTPVAMLVARLLIDKGVYEFVDAAKTLKQQACPVRMVLVGDVDENPKSVSAEEISRWVDEGIVEYWGYRKNISATIADANMVVLPSYREGLPKCLIEAAACGRAVITTDVPGCRDAITPNVTGMLINVKSASSLATAIQTLVENPERREEMGRQGRILAEQAFDIKTVVQKHMNLYEGRGADDSGYW